MTSPLRILAIPGALVSAHALDVSELLTASESAHAMALPAGEVPEWVHLLPLGEFRGRDGRGPYRLSSAQEVIDRTAANAHGQPLPMDYDHQLEYCEQNGQPAPASAWITKVEARADGLWGKVDWTPAAAAKLKAREYRFLSPVFAHTKDGEVLALLRAALTNKPNLALTAINAREGKGRDSMDPLKMLQSKLGLIAVAIGLPETAEADAVVTSVNAIATSEKSHREALRKIGAGVKLDDKATPDQIVTAAAVQFSAAAGASSATPDPKKFVPVEQVTAMATQLQTLMKERSEETVDAAIKAGKVLPALRDWAIGMHSSDPRAFAEYVDKAPVVLVEGQEQHNDRRQHADRRAVSLSAADKSICATMGISEEQFLSTKKADQSTRTH